MHVRLDSGEGEDVGYGALFTIPLSRPSALP